MSLFTEEFTKILGETTENQQVLCVAMEEDPARFSDIKHGRRWPTALFVNNFCLAANVPNSKRKNLHALAARDRGWEV